MIDSTAIIGSPPEHREHRNEPGMEPRIHPTARIEALVTIDAGFFRATVVGARSWLMKKAHVGHDALIGEDCEIAPLASVGGEVEIGDRVKIGQGALFKPRVKVGDDAVIGMGAVVIKDVPAGVTVVGNPARPLLSRHTPSAEWEEWWDRSHAPAAATGEVMSELELLGWEELAAG